MKRALLVAGLVGITACSEATSPTRLSVESLRPTASLAPGNNTVTVGEADVTRAAENTPPANNWMLYTRVITADVESGDFVAGPGSPPLGNGSFRTVTATTDSKVWLFNYDHIGTALSTIDGISYSTYKDPSAATVVAFPSLNIQIDINGGTFNTGEFRTLVFEPYEQPGFINGTGAWDTRDAYNGGNAKWWSTGSSPCPQATPCTWTDILAAFPGATILGGFGINQGSGNPGLDGSSDALTIAYGGNSITYDFEDTTCYFTTSGSTWTLRGDCDTTNTILIPQGFTLDGNGYTITAKDPAGGHFLGAVIENEGTSAHVIDLTVTASGLADICDGEGPPDNRLRGILFDGASGSITNSTVTNVNQGPSGCQEGNAIEARNAPFDKTGPDVNVTITGNTVNGYIKNGITVNGSVVATVTGNVVTGAGAVGVPLAAQNGIQVAFGATATVKGNSISGNNYTPKDWTACGLLIYQADGVKASGNTFLGNEMNQCNFGKGSANVKASN